MAQIVEIDQPQGAARIDSLNARAFSPELRFILLAVRVWGGAEDPELLRAAAGAGLDWEVVVQGLTRHGLLWLTAPLLAAEDIVPAPAAAALRQMNAANAVATLQRIDEAVRVARAFEQAGIRFVMIKGVPLSVQLYRDPARRAGRDLDFVIERGKAGQVDAILTGLGYFRPDNGVPDAAGTAPIVKEIGYLHSRSRILVEVHDRLTDNAELLSWDCETLWADRETVPVGPYAMPTMARHRLPVYLCVHGAKHGWARLMWLHDLAVLIDTPEAAERALTAAAALGLDGAMLHGFARLHAWFGHSIPPAILARAHASRQVRLLDRLAARFHRDAGWHEQPGRHSWRRFWQGSVLSRSIGYAIKPDRRYWRRQLALELFSPADRQLITLPAGLAWLYPVLRPVGWLARRWKLRRD